VIADGLHVATNAHVLPLNLDSDKREILAIFFRKSNTIEIREASKVAEDRDHDMVILKITDQPLPAMALGDADRVREDEIYAFTGFPIGKDSRVAAKLKSSFCRPSPKRYYCIASNTAVPPLTADGILS